MNTPNADCQGLMRVRSLLLRFFLLSLLVIPVFNGSFMKWLISPAWVTQLPQPLINITAFVVYAAVVYAVIAWTFGVKGLTQMLAVSFVLALTVVITMVAISKTPFVGDWLQGSKDSTQVDAIAIEQFFHMIVVIPMGLLFIHCFPPSELISKLRSPSGKVSERVVRVAIVLRIYSIVVDAIVGFYAAWREENPAIVLPRYRKDIGGTDKLWKLPMWFIGAAGIWGLALITYCIEQIPQLIMQLDTTLDLSTEGHCYVENK